MWTEELNFTMWYLLDNKELKSLKDLSESLNSQGSRERQRIVGIARLELEEASISNRIRLLSARSEFIKKEIADLKGRKQEENE